MNLNYGYKRLKKGSRNFQISSLIFYKKTVKISKKNFQKLFKKFKDSKVVKIIFKKIKSSDKGVKIVQKLNFIKKSC